MTKYPNARIKGINGAWYVDLDDKSTYLFADGKAYNWYDGNNWKSPNSLIYFKTHESAQQALDKFNKMKPASNKKKQKQITLSEIKTQLEGAKKLIGKKVKRINGDNCGKVYKIDEVKLFLTDETCPRGPLHDQFFKQNGYAISLGSCGSAWTLYDDDSFKEVKEIIVENHSGIPYVAVNDGDFVSFGCAKIDKALIKAAYELLDRANVGNRNATKITIGAADFDKETLKSLLEME